MSRISSLLLAGLASLGVTLAPATSQAQTPFGVNLSFGNSNFSYQQGYTPWGPHVVPVAPVVVAPGPAACGPTVVAPVYARYPQPAIVVPYGRPWGYGAYGTYGGYGNGGHHHHHAPRGPYGPYR